MVGEALDPSSQGVIGEPMRLGVPEVSREHRAVMGIDATRPLHAKYPAVVLPPGDVAERVAARWPEIVGPGGARGAE